MRDTETLTVMRPLSEFGCAPQKEIHGKGLSPQQHYIQWNFLGQSAVSRCEGFPTFRELTPSSSSGCAGGLVAPKLMTSCIVGLIFIISCAYTDNMRNSKSSYTVWTDSGICES